MNALQDETFLVHILVPKITQDILTEARSAYQTEVPDKTLGLHEPKGKWSLIKPWGFMNRKESEPHRSETAFQTMVRTSSSVKTGRSYGDRTELWGPARLAQPEMAKTAFVSVHCKYSR